MNDPMQGSPEQRRAYLDKINEMIQQDIEQRKAERLAEFKNSRDARGVLIGGSSGADPLINAIEQ